MESTTIATVPITAPASLQNDMMFRPETQLTATTFFPDSSLNSSSASARKASLTQVQSTLLSLGSTIGQQPLATTSQANQSFSLAPVNPNQFNVQQAAFGVNSGMQAFNGQPVGISMPFAANQAQTQNNQFNAQQAASGVNSGMQAFNGQPVGISMPFAANQAQTQNSQINAQQIASGVNSGMQSFNGQPVGISLPFAANQAQTQNSQINAQQIASGVNSGMQSFNGQPVGMSMPFTGKQVQTWNAQFSFQTLPQASNTSFGLNNSSNGNAHTPGNNIFADMVTLGNPSTVPQTMNNTVPEDRYNVFRGLSEAQTSVFNSVPQQPARNTIPTYMQTNSGSGSPSLNNTPSQPRQFQNQPLTSMKSSSSITDFTAMGNPFLPSFQAQQGFGQPSGPFPSGNPFAPGPNYVATSSPFAGT